MSVNPDVAANLLQRLADLGVIHCGQSPASADVNNLGQGVPYVSGPEQWNGATVELSKWTTNPKRLAPPNCVFITVKGAGVGTVFPGVEGAIGRDIYAFEPKPGVRRSYLEHVLRFTASRVVANAKGDIPGLSKRDLLEHRVPLPAEKNQDAIVAEIEKQFTRLDAGVAALKRVQTKLKRYRAAVLKAACEGRLVETKGSALPHKVGEYALGASVAAYSNEFGAEDTIETSAGEVRSGSSDPPVPSGWQWSSIDQIGAVSGGLTKNPRRQRLTLKLPYLRVANVYANALRLDNVETIGVDKSELSRFALERGDLLVVEGNGSREQIGRVAVWQGAIDPCLHQNHIIRVRPTEPSLSRWLLVWLMSPRGRRQVEAVASSTSGLYTLSLSKVGRIPVPIPPAVERLRIVAEVERRLSVVEEQEAVVAINLQRAARLRQAILQAAFSGGLVGVKKEVLGSEITGPTLDGNHTS